MDTDTSLKTMTFYISILIGSTPSFIIKAVVEGALRTLHLLVGIYQHIIKIDVAIYIHHIPAHISDITSESYVYAQVKYICVDIEERNALI